MSTAYDTMTSESFLSKVTFERKLSDGIHTRASFLKVFFRKWLAVIGQSETCDIVYND